MPSILNLKFKGNKSFVAFSNLNDTEALTQTWKVCTKVASYLEQGQRLENLSWRLWHLQNLMVDTDNAKSKREFKKLSRCMGDKLDKEKGRSIEELSVPDFKRNPSSDLLRQRAEEKERTREANTHATGHTLQRMQFTFAAPGAAGDAQPTTGSVSTFATSTAPAPAAPSSTTTTTNTNTKRKRPTGTDPDAHTQALRLPTLFNSSFGPSALLAPQPTFAPRMDYGEAHAARAYNNDNNSMRVARPTIEMELDELLNATDEPVNNNNNNNPAFSFAHAHNDHSSSASSSAGYEPPLTLDPNAAFSVNFSHESSKNGRFFGEDEGQSSASIPVPAASSQTHSVSAPRSAGGAGRSKAMRPPSAVPGHGSRGSASAGAAVGGGGQAAVVLGAPNGGGSANTAPGGVKAECSNCGATHTPLWRRGLNDELNCNACGLYCKLHKRPRPKTMRNTAGGGEGRGQSARSETVDVMAQCYNCHTTATPLWRKDDEGKTVCNACGLYYKLHGAPRPISMKSDVIRKRSRHDVRRGGASVPETPTASPGVSRRASPAPGASSSSASGGCASPILAPDSSTTGPFTTSSELSGAIGPVNKPYHYSYQEPYPDALPFSNIDVRSELDVARANKRRRMSVDSASEPPSSAVSFGSAYQDGYTSAGSQFSMEFPFSRYPALENGNGGNGGGAFWHPPMLVQGDKGNQHEDAPMDYLHPPMAFHQQQEEDNLNNYFEGLMQQGRIHPPMLPGADEYGIVHPPMMIHEDFYDSSGNMRF
ncbi:hypothetical protein FB45DRAFT_758213 [Roridomyces roridus]|uniref:GATA-type domain-containing protein n=1 Tax=Roridomyces roridus TaxID=1738132 RepID=A0AAD7FF59_9AGAR|nr:hypothetical protein FB45DRAFT_758213 [Roridomyces roridus]